ncbi:MAG: hypothetical protein HY554_17930 [Elusimicrobia bacterium]|nr:hypothetical protein [Elusimicrobiota bacterium]
MAQPPWTPVRAARALSLALAALPLSPLRAFPAPEDFAGQAQAALDSAGLLGRELGAGAPRLGRADARGDEVASFVLSVHRSNLGYLASELATRSAELAFAPALTRLIRERQTLLTDRVARRLRPDTDLLGELERELLDASPSDADEIRRLVAAVRRLASAPEEPALRPAAIAQAPARRLTLNEGASLGSRLPERADVALQQPEALARARFGPAAEFVIARGWGLDFFQGSLQDLVARYRAEGYRTFAQVRAPNLSNSKEVTVASGRPGEPPRLIYSGFHGAYYFEHVRAQFATIARSARLRPGQVRTISCDGCPWERPAVAAVQRLLARVDAPHTLLVGFDVHLDTRLRGRYIETVEHGSWRLHLFDIPEGRAGLLAGDDAHYGETAGLMVEAFLKAGTRRVFFAGLTGGLHPSLRVSQLVFPRGFLDERGRPLDAPNLLATAGESGAHQDVRSPFFESFEWAAAALRGGAWTVDCEAAGIAAAVERHKAGGGRPVELGVGLVVTDLVPARPGARRAPYSLGSQDVDGKLRGVEAYGDRVLAALFPGSRP